MLEPLPSCHFYRRFEEKVAATQQITFRNNTLFFLKSSSARVKASNDLLLAADSGLDSGFTPWPRLTCWYSGPQCLNQLSEVLPFISYRSNRSHFGHTLCVVLLLVVSILGSPSYSLFILRHLGHILRSCSIDSPLCRWHPALWTAEPWFHWGFTNSVPFNVQKFSTTEWISTRS